MVKTREDSVETWKNELVQEVLLWWKEHEYDVHTIEHEDWTEEYNVYNYEPKFVTLAKRVNLRLK